MSGYLHPSKSVLFFFFPHMSGDYSNMHQEFRLLQESGRCCIMFASVFVLFFESLRYAVWLNIKASGMSGSVVVHTGS